MSKKLKSLYGPETHTLERDLALVSGSVGWSRLPNTKRLRVQSRQGTYGRQQIDVSSTRCLFLFLALSFSHTLPLSLKSINYFFKKEKGLKVGLCPTHTGRCPVCATNGHGPIPGGAQASSHNAADGGPTTSSPLASPPSTGRNLVIGNAGCCAVTVAHLD